MLADLNLNHKSNLSWFFLQVEKKNTFFLEIACVKKQKKSKKAVEFLDAIALYRAIGQKS